jgi:hypothetical protein
LRGHGLNLTTINQKLWELTEGNLQKGTYRRELTAVPKSL